MPSLFKKGQHPNFNLLKKEQVLDAKSEKAIKDILKKYKKVAILGSFNSGKDNLKQACLEFYHKLHKLPVILPSIEVNSLGSFFNTPTWKKYAKILNQNLPSIFAISHRAHLYNADSYYNKFNKFDALIDIRKLPNGKQIVYQVLVHSNGNWKATYVNEQFFIQCGHKIIAA